jgi:hypothetical protein
MEDFSISEFVLSTNLATTQGNLFGSRAGVEDQTELVHAEALALAAWRTEVLSNLRCVGLLTQLQKGLHLLADEVSSAFIAEIDLILVDDHDPHSFPLLPAASADLGLDLGLEFAKEEGSCDRFTGLSAGNARNLCHNPPCSLYWMSVGVQESGRSELHRSDRVRILAEVLQRRKVLLIDG